MRRSMLANVVVEFRWFGRQIVAQFGAHGLLDSAASLTYTTLFAVVPLMTVSYTILSMFPDFSTMGQQIQAFVFQNFVPASSAVIQERLEDFSRQARELTVAGFAFLLVTAFMMLVTMEKAFNEIWQVAEPRRGMHRFFVYWAVMTGGPPLVVAGLLISSYLISLPLITNEDTAVARQALLGWLPVLFSFIGFTVLFFGVPNCRVRFRDAIVGGLLTTLFFEGAKRFFTTIIGSANMQLVYGTFAAVPLFLTWVYLVWILILSGAIVVRTLGIERDDVVSDGAPMLVQTVRLLAFLRRAHLDGRPITRTDLNDAVKLSGAERDEVLTVLGEFKLVTSGTGDQLLLGRDLRGISLLELYRRLPHGLDADKLASVHDLPRLIAPLLENARYGESHLDIDLDSILKEDEEAQS
jgi:membrane protein